MQISVAKLIDHAVRRCGVTTPLENPELLLMAKDNLQFVLWDMANRGVPVWEVVPFILGLEPYKWQFDMSEFAYDIFNVNWRTYSHATVTPSGGDNPEALNDFNWDTTATTTDSFLLTMQDESEPVLTGSNVLDVAQLGPCDPNVLFTLADFPQEQRIGYWGINPVGDQIHSFVIEISTNVMDWTIVSSYTDYNFIAGTWLWIDLDTPLNAIAIRLRLTNETSKLLSLRGFYTGGFANMYEQVSAKQNRDDFFAYPNKGTLGTPVNYYFLKDTIPQFQIWQSAANANVFKWAMHGYMMYIPPVELNLPLELPVPKWFYDGIAWNLAAKLVYELPNIEAARIPMIKQEADKAMNQMEASNSDSSNFNVVGDALNGYKISNRGGRR